MSFHKEPKTDTQHQNHLDGATKILNSDLQQEANRAGLDNTFQNWIQDIKDADNPEFHQIVTDLQDLKAHFGSGTLDKSIIKRLLSRLGENTLRAAVFAENSNTADRVTQLGQALIAASKQVTNNENTPAQDLAQDSANSK